jgi:hypothetical protein
MVATEVFFAEVCAKPSCVEVNNNRVRESECRSVFIIDKVTKNVPKIKTEDGNIVK